MLRCLACTHKCLGRVGRTPEREDSTCIQYPWDWFQYLVPSTLWSWHLAHGKQEALDGAVRAEGADVSRPVAFQGWAPDLVFYDVLYFNLRALQGRTPWCNPHKCPPTTGHQPGLHEASDHSGSLVGSPPLTQWGLGVRPEHESAEMSMQTSWQSHSPICPALARSTVGPGQRRFLCKAMLAEGGFWAFYKL